MQLFVQIGTNCQVIDCECGDLIDIIILQAFQRYFIKKNISFKKLVKINKPNIFKMSRFSMNNSNIKFGSKVRVSRDMNEMTIIHCYLACSSKKFTKLDIDYINNIMNYPKL